MADEPRRSGRATKGQHTKNQEESVDVAPKSKGRGKAKKQEEVEEEEEEETVRCLCGAEEDEDDEGRAFTCCDNCNVWQHNDCMGLPLKYNPAEYFCEQCRPENHPIITEALSRGEKAADIAARNREEAHSRKKGKKGKAARTSEVQEEPAPPTPTPASEPQKRKHAGDATSTQPTKVRKPSTVADPQPTPTKSPRKPVVDSTKPTKLVDNISDIKNSGRQNTAQALKKKFAQVIKEHSSKGQFRIPDGHTPDSLSDKYAISVENSMYTNHCGASPDPTPPYKDQFRNITSNVGLNPSLLWDLIEERLTADTLSTMSSGDMATDEQKKRDQQIKDENERLAQLKEDQSTRRIRRTHKGEEYVEDEDEPYGKQPQGGEPMAGVERPKPTAIQSADPAKPPSINTDRNRAGSQDGQSRSPGERRPSSNFNIKNVWSSVQSPTGDVRSPSQTQVSQFPTRQAQPGTNNDTELDRLLGDDDGPESAPYSPTESGVDPSFIWHGKVDMPSLNTSIACFDARAYHVAGGDLWNRENLVSIFPKDITLGGRIAADKADDYLKSLSAATKTDVSVLDLVPNNMDGKSPSEFTKLFDYLKQRSRFGVIKEPHNPPVRDVYLVPVEQGSEPLPVFLTRLGHNNIEEPRPRRMLLIVYVLRYKSPPASAQATPTNAQATPGNAPPSSAMSPTVPGSAFGGAGPGPQQQASVRPPSNSAPVMSPPNFPNGASTQQPADAQHPPLPENPYAPTPPQQQASAPVQNPYNGQSTTAPIPSGAPPIGQTPPQPTTAGQPQTTQQQSPETIAMARAILGEYYICPTATQLMSQYPMTQDLLQQLRRVFDQRPETRTDFMAFQRALSMGS